MHDLYGFEADDIATADRKFGPGARRQVDRRIGAQRENLQLQPLGKLLRRVAPQREFPRRTLVEIVVVEATAGVNAGDVAFAGDLQEGARRTGQRVRRHIEAPDGGAGKIGIIRLDRDRARPRHENNWRLRIGDTGHPSMARFTRYLAMTRKKNFRFARKSA